MGSGNYLALQLPGTTNYVFTPTAGQCANTQTLSITITALVTPDFAAIGPLCQNSTPPVLAGTSPNGIAGTWAPATISYCNSRYN
jgi:hypothetical protein